MNTGDAKTGSLIFVTFKNRPLFARLRERMQMIVDVGT
jgi:hypothetical protein